MRIRLPQRVVKQGGGASLGRVSVPRGGQEELAVAKSLGDAGNLFNKIAIHEKKKHLEAIRDDYTARINTAAEDKVQALQELQGEELGALDRPGVSAQYAKDATDALEKEVQEMVDPLNEEEKAAATSQLNPILHSYNKGVHRYVAREQEQYQEKSYKKALANYSVMSARDPLGTMPDGSGRRVVRYKYWDKTAEMRIRQRANDRGWSKEETAAQTMAYYNSAVTDRVASLMADDREELAVKHLEVMRNKIDPEIYLRLRAKAGDGNDRAKAQRVVDAVWAMKGLSQTQRNAKIRKQLKGQAEHYGISDSNNRWSIERQQRDQHRAERARSLFNNAYNLRNMMEAGQGNSPEAKALFRRLGKGQDGLDRKDKKAVVEILRGHDSVTNQAYLAQILELAKTDKSAFHKLNVFALQDISIKDKWKVVEAQTASMAGKSTLDTQVNATINRGIRAVGLNPKKKTGAKMFFVVKAWAEEVQRATGAAPDDAATKKFVAEQKKDFDVVDRFFDKPLRDVTPTEFADTLIDLYEDDPDKAEDAIPAYLWDFVKQRILKRKGPNYPIPPREFIEEAIKVFNITHASASE